MKSRHNFLGKTYYESNNDVQSHTAALRPTITKNAIPKDGTNEVIFNEFDLEFVILYLGRYIIY